jgi:hypothetical protein
VCCFRYPTGSRRRPSRSACPFSQFAPDRQQGRLYLLTTKVAAPRARKSFSRLKHVLDLPNLIDIQKASFQWFMDEGLRETIDDISPIEDYTGTLAVEFESSDQFTLNVSRDTERLVRRGGPASIVADLPDSVVTYATLLEAVIAGDRVTQRRCVVVLREQGEGDWLSRI